MTLDCTRQGGTHVNAMALLPYLVVVARVGLTGRGRSSTGRVPEKHPTTDMIMIIIERAGYFIPSSSCKHEKTLLWNGGDGKVHT